MQRGGGEVSKMAKVTEAVRRICALVKVSHGVDVVAGLAAIEQGITAADARRTLWRAKLASCSGSFKFEFLFRESDAIAVATATAQQLLESSPSADFVGLIVVAVERVATLRN